MSDARTENGHAPDTAPPAWADITDDIECGRCGYNLRGLAEPRCPECGLRFTWAEMLDPRRREHPYLFEHHAHRRPIRSFVRTFVGTLNPLRFWRTLTLQQPCHGKRLILFWLIVAACVPLFAALVGIAILTLTMFIAINESGTGAAMPEYDWFLNRSLWGTGIIFEAIGTRMSFFQRQWASAGDALEIYSLVACFQIATVAALLVFQQTLAHCRVRSYHVLRVGIYGGTVLLASLFALNLVGMANFAIEALFFSGQSFPGVPALLGPATFVLIAIHWWMSLWCAYRHYLEIAVPISMLLVSQVIATLVAVVFADYVLAWAVYRLIWKMF